MFKITFKQWIEALKSGEYQQGKSLLRSSDDHFCCLGVACAVEGVPAVMPKYDEADRYQYDFSGYFEDEQGTRFHSAIIPNELSSHLGLNHKNFAWGGDTPSWNKETMLMQLNDQGYTFEQIADLLIFDCWMEGIEQ